MSAASVGSSLLLMAALAGLAPSAGPLGAAEPMTPAQEERDTRLEQVRQSEIAFAATVAARDKMRFAAMIAEDAVFVGGGGVTRGRDAIVAEWAPYFEPTAPEFEWHPEIVELTQDGALGLTRGPWTLRGKDAKGNPLDLAGTFNSVWRRQPDGGWLVTFDAGCSPCPKCD